MDRDVWRALLEAGRRLVLRRAESWLEGGGRWRALRGDEAAVGGGVRAGPTLRQESMVYANLLKESYSSVSVVPKGDSAGPLLFSAAWK